VAAWLKLRNPRELFFSISLSKIQYNLFPLDHTLIVALRSILEKYNITLNLLRNGTISLDVLLIIRGYIYI
jgi:hypothetical protein